MPRSASNLSFFTNGIEEGIESSLRDMLGDNQDVDGLKIVTDILNLTGSSVDKSVLDNMDG